MEKVKTYYPYMDGLKGIAILFMVMAHVLAWSYPETTFLSKKLCELNTVEFNASILFKLIYSFHMPLLFIVSGFLFYKPIDYNITTARNVIKKRMKRLFIPYLVTGCFVLYLKGYFGYWFLQILFIVNIVSILECLLLNSIKASLKAELVSHAIIFVLLFILGRFMGHFELPKEFQNITGLDGYYLAFMWGYLLRQIPKLLCIVSKPTTGFLCFIFYVLLFALTNSHFSLPLINYTIPIAASAFLWSTFQHIDYQSIIGGGKFLSFIGKNSLEIYILHLFFVMPFKEVGSYILLQDNFAFSITIQIVYSLIVSFIAIYLSVTVARFLKLNKYLSRLIFGI